MIFVLTVIFIKDKDGYISLEEYKQGAMMYPGMLKGLGLFKEATPIEEHTRSMRNKQMNMVTFGNEEQWNFVLKLMIGISKSVSDRTRKYLHSPFEDCQWACFNRA